MSEKELLINVCSKVIGIPVFVLKELIRQNKTTKYFLENEMMLEHGSSLENLKILVRLLLLREYGDLTPFSNRDIEFIYENYSLYGSFVNELTLSRLKNYNDIEIINLFVELRGVPENIKINTYLKNHK